MHVCANHIVDACAFRMILAIVAGTVRVDDAERLHAFAQEGLAGMVFVADDVAEIGGMLGQIADHAHFLADRVRADHADAVKSGTIHRFEIFAEQLIQAADHEHGGAVCGQRAQQVGAFEEVVDDFLLAGVLPAAAQNHIDVFGPRVALIVGVHVRFVAVQRESALDGEYVAGVAIDVHVFRI